MRAALSAARRTERRLKVYAIEKNPNAVVTLHRLVAAERSDLPAQTLVYSHSQTIALLLCCEVRGTCFVVSLQDHVPMADSSRVCNLVS